MLFSYAFNKYLIPQHTNTLANDINSWKLIT